MPSGSNKHNLPLSWVTKVSSVLLKRRLLIVKVMKAMFPPNALLMPSFDSVCKECGVCVETIGYVSGTFSTVASVQSVRVICTLSKTSCQRKLFKVPRHCLSNSHRSKAVQVQPKELSQSLLRTWLFLEVRNATLRSRFYKYLQRFFPWLRWPALRRCKLLLKV
jgi:hypothetical protein